ncbi:cysteine proteinase inhibitor 4 [Raphanus sativus]|uniref:Cysteine proteinase inhibitor 4 n=1 Tax=Raphanus sativus TaxID=3726 RepID=A0A6J0LY34_RAPSA|nr:cysteine proteinase inhibitor 4 [Raphanus sativus]
MTMKSLICLSLILLPLIAVVEGNLGGWKNIENLSDPNVVSLAKYAVDEHNKQSKANLVFVKIVEGKEQVVSGKKYDLKIAAKDGGGATKNYEAVVVERVWAHYRSLESFKAV